MEIFKFKNPRRVYLYVLLSFLMCMLGASSMSGRTPRNPIVKLISGPTYSDNGTEVTLKLWMYNYDGDNAYFLNNVMLRIDDKDACTLNNMWNLISNVHAKNENNIKNYQNSGNVGSQGTITYDGVNVGTAQFCNAQKKQKCPYNSNTGETKWTTIELKLSFNNSFSYRKHTVSVNGNWRDRCDDSKYNDKIWDLQNTLHGFIYPTNLDISRIGYNVEFTWTYPGWDNNESSKGKWVLYKKENGTSVKQAEATSPYMKVITIAGKDFRCLATYYLTFLPNGFSETATISGLTVSKSRGSHTTLDGVCRFCQHGIFSYTTADGKIVNNISNPDQFGANIVAHSVVDGKCVIEFDAPITKIPANAFYNKNSLTGDLVIPNSVTEIGEQAFYNCTGFNGTLTLSSKLGKIGKYAFNGCTGFTGSLKLPSSLTDIGIAAFLNCKYFTSLELSNALSVIPGSAFRGCEGLSGSLVIPDGVKEIGASAFSGCTGFDGTLTLSNKLETIGVSAFNGCTGFTGSLTLPSSVTTIGQSAFSACRSFTSLELPNTLSVIPIQAFMHCRSLSGELVIPASVTEIGNLAFYDCQNLSAVTGQVTLPKSLKKIGKDVFLNTDNINTVNFQSLPEGISGFLGQKKKAVSLSDESYISDKASGTVNEISYTRQMSNNWGTLVLPYSLTLTGEESYRLYTIDKMEGEELVLKQLEGTVAAGTPCVVKRNGTEAKLTFGPNYATLNMARVAQDVGGMKFRGTYWTEDVNSGYVISKNSFWNVEELKGLSSVNGVKVRPFRAWLDGTSANAPAQLSMRIDGSTTGINAAEALDALNDAEAEYYDLSGKRLDEPQRGVNIVRMKSGKTKKIIIK